MLPDTMLYLIPELLYVAEVRREGGGRREGGKGRREGRELKHRHSYEGTGNSISLA